MPAYGTAVITKSKNQIPIVLFSISSITLHKLQNLKCLLWKGLQKYKSSYKIKDKLWSCTTKKWYIHIFIVHVILHSISISYFTTFIICIQFQYCGWYISGIYLRFDELSKRSVINPNVTNNTILSTHLSKYTFSSGVSFTPSIRCFLAINNISVWDLSSQVGYYEDYCLLGCDAM
jgi:hypothetical protein